MSVWRLSKKFSFEASHQLMHHDGKCARLHGHSWKGEIMIESPGLHGKGPKENMVMDFADLKAPLKPIIDQYLDHHHLNKTLSTDMPTSEFVAQWLFRMLERSLAVVSVTIEETCTSRCEYRE